MTPHVIKLPLIAGLLLAISGCQFINSETFFIKSAKQKSVAVETKSLPPTKVQTDHSPIYQYSCGRGTIFTTGKFDSASGQDSFWGSPIPAPFGVNTLIMPLAASDFVLDGNSCPIDLFIIEGVNNELIEPSGVTEIRQQSQKQPALLCFYRVPSKRLGNNYRIRFYPERMACSLPSLVVNSDTGNYSGNRSGI